MLFVYNVYYISVCLSLYYFPRFFNNQSHQNYKTPQMEVNYLGAQNKRQSH